MEKLAFIQTVVFQDERNRQLHFVGDIDWGDGDANQTAPLNEPVCGYSGENGPCAVLGNIHLQIGSHEF